MFRPDIYFRHVPISRAITLASSLWMVSICAAGAQTCPSYPNTLTNGQTADANAVMGNFNSILNCANNNLAPSSGGTLNNTTLNGTTPVTKLQFPDGTTQTTAKSATQISSVRQTVQGGPATSGLPSFLPATSASLSITSQNVSTGTSVLTISAAQGYGTSGQLDYVMQFTANLTWSLAANATNYLYVNAQSGATTASILQPIYQYGGTISTVNNQFTFDYQGMVGYLGNGSSGVATPLVAVGQAVTSASGVTGTAAYAYNGYYQSAWVSTLPIPNGTPTTISHNIGLVPKTAEISIQCLTANNGYLVGDTLALRGNTVTYPQGTVTLNSTAASWAQTNGQNYQVLSKTGSSVAALTYSQWSYSLFASRGW